MERIQQINYKNKKLLYGNHSGLRGKELVENVSNLSKKVLLSDESEILVLSNFSDTYANEELSEYLRSQEVKMTGQKMTKIAVVGITGIKKIFLNVYNQFIGGKTKAFETEDEAKEWLVAN
jgi:hypothetical protein